MKQGRLVYGCVNRRGSEKGRGRMALDRETAFVEDASRGMRNLMRGVAASTDRSFGLGAVNVFEVTKRLECGRSVGEVR